MAEISYNPRPNVGAINYVSSHISSMKARDVYKGTFTLGTGDLNLISMETQMIDERWLLEGIISLSIKSDTVCWNARYSKGTIGKQARSYFAIQTTWSWVSRPSLSSPRADWPHKACIWLWLMQLLFPRGCEIWQTMGCSSHYWKGGCDCRLTLRFLSFLFLPREQPDLLASFIFFYNLSPKSSSQLSQFFFLFSLLFPPLFLFPSLPSLFSSLPLFLNFCFLLPPPLSFFLFSVEKGEAETKDSFSRVKMINCVFCMYCKNTHQTKLINFNTVTVHQASGMFCFPCPENTWLNFPLFQCNNEFPLWATISCPYLLYVFTLHVEEESPMLQSILWIFYTRVITHNNEISLFCYSYRGEQVLVDS